MKHQTSKLMFYRPSEGKIINANFIYTKLASGRKVSINQFITPTFLTHLAEVLSSLIDRYLVITISCDILGWGLCDG